jgi:hypothetical protein
MAVGSLDLLGLFELTYELAKDTFALTHMFCTSGDPLNGPGGENFVFFFTTAIFGPR